MHKDSAILRLIAPFLTNDIASFATDFKMNTLIKELAINFRTTSSRAFHHISRYTNKGKMTHGGQIDDM